MLENGLKITKSPEIDDKIFFFFKNKFGDLIYGPKGTNGLMPSLINHNLFHPTPPPPRGQSHATPLSDDV